jgi:external thioesterase TEII
MLPFGGGSGYSYMSLVNELPGDIEVLVINPPGHLMNGGKALESIAAMVYVYTRELRPLVKETALFFGHSIGGLVAYEVVKELQNTVPVKGMVISSANPPHLISDAVDMHSEMDTDELIRKSNKMGGVPQIFKEEPVLLESFINGLRGDLKALENYSAVKPNPNGKLNTTAAVLYSENDYIVNIEKLKEWELYLDCREYIPFPGNHFYLLEDEHRPVIAGILDRYSIA